MKGFRVASVAPTWRHVATTLAQIVVFWSTFLWLLPNVVHWLERKLEVPAMALPYATAIGASLFGLASALGLTTGMLMAVRGRGTPLPLQAAREFVVQGPYRALRNPMALAGITQGVAVGIWRDSAAIVLYALCGALMWHFIARPPEERDLAERFGATFTDYRDRVPLWIPRLGNRTTERIVALLVLLPTAFLWLLPNEQAIPLDAIALLCGGYLLWRSRDQANNSGQNSAKSASSAS